MRVLEWIVGIAAVCASLVGIVGALYQVTAHERRKRRLTYHQTLIAGTPSPLRPALEAVYYQEMGAYLAHIAVARAYRPVFLLFRPVTIALGLAMAAGLGAAIAQERSFLGSSFSETLGTLGMCLTFCAGAGGHLAQTLWRRRALSDHIGEQLAAHTSPDPRELALAREWTELKSGEGRTPASQWWGGVASGLAAAGLTLTGAFFVAWLLLHPEEVPVGNVSTPIALTAAASLLAAAVGVACLLPSANTTTSVLLSTPEWLSDEDGGSSSDTPPISEPSEDGARTTAEARAARGSDTAFDG